MKDNDRGYSRFKRDGRQLVVCPRCNRQKISHTLVICSACKGELKLKGNWQKLWEEELAAREPEEAETEQAFHEDWGWEHEGEPLEVHP